MLKPSLFLTALLLATAAQADYLWLQPAGDGSAQVRAGELHKPLAALPALRSPTAAQVRDKPLPVTTQADRFSIQAPAPGDLRFSAVQPGAQGVLTYHQARLGRQDTQALNDLELVPTAAGGRTFKLVWKGKAVAAAQVHVETSAGWQRTLVPAADGTVTLDTPFPGLYVLEVSARVNGGSVTLDGKQYDDVRHTATLTFEVRP